MIPEKQRLEIKKRMRRIKDAKDENKPKQVIEQRTAELYRYLESQGLIDPYDD